MKIGVIILAAGKGERLKEVTKECPKPMLSILGKPILEYTIRQLVSCGFKDMAINIHYKAEQITNYFQDGDAFNCRLTYLYEDQLSGTAGAVKKLTSFVNRFEKIFVIYGDILTDYQFNLMINDQRKIGKKFLVGIHKNLNSNSFFEVDDVFNVLSFCERPKEQKIFLDDSKVWTNSAIYLFDREVVTHIEENCYQDFPLHLFLKFLAMNELAVTKIQGNRIAIDDQARLELAQERVKEFNFLDQTIIEHIRTTYENRF